MVVGVTNESKALVEKAVESKRMQFPVAMVDSEEEQPFGVRGVPSSYLLDVDGTILWTGHPGRFESQFGLERLERLLETTTSLPRLPDEQTRSVARHLEQRAYGKAHGAITKALKRDPGNAELQAFVDRLESLVSTKMDAGRDLEERGEYGRARALYEQLKAEFRGVPGAAQAKQSLADLKANKAARDELAAADKWNDAMQQWRKGEFEKALLALESLVKQYPGTPTGDRADEMLFRHG